MSGRFVLAILALSGLACAGGTPPSPPPLESTPTSPSAPPPSEAPLEGTLCVSGEESLLTCGTASGGLLSLCGRGERVRYRFGLPGAVELEYPEEEQAVQDAFGWTSTITQGGMGAAPGGQYSKLSFANGDVRYTVDEAYVGEPPVIRILIDQPGRPQAILDCNRDIDGNLSYLATKMSLPVEEAGP